MAKTVIGATVEVDVKNSSKNIEDLKSEIEKLRSSLDGLDKDSKEYSDTLDKINQEEAKLKKQTDELGKSVAKTGDESKKTGGAFSKLGGFIKGLGIVAGITAAFGLLKNAFDNNSKAAGFLNGIITSIQAIFNKLVEIVVNVSTKVSESTNGFEGLTGVLKGLGKILGGTLKLAFSTIGLLIQEAQLAWEKSFFGDGDPKSIKELTESIELSKKSIKEAAELALEGGKNVITNIGKAATEVGQVVGGVIDEAQKIDSKFIQNAFQQGQALQQLAGNAAIAKEKLAGIRAESERDAELLRRTRDDQRNSIEDRIAANNELFKVLERQRTASLAEADVAIKKAETEFALNKGNRELEAAAIAARNQRKDIEAQIVGLFNEQQQNLSALELEQKARDKAATEGANSVYLANKKANAETIQDELLKNQKLQEIRDEERKIELARLQELINIAKEGTQARVDAEIAYNQKKQELDAADQVAANERAKIIRERALAETTARNENAIAEIALRKQLNDQARIDAIEKTEIAIQLAKEETAALIEQLHIKRDAEIAAAQAAGLSIVEIKKKYEIQESEINNRLVVAEQALAQARLNSAMQTIDAWQNAISQLSGLFSVAYQNELAALDEQKQMRIQAAGDNKEAVLAIEQETAIARQKILDKQFKMDKTMAIVEATINTFKAAAQVFARPAPGDPVTSLSIKIATMVAAIASGIANVAKIRKVQAPSGFSSGDSGGGISTASPLSMSTSASVMATAVNTQAVNNLSNQGVRAYVLNSDIQNTEQRNAYLERSASVGGTEGFLRRIGWIR
jgi:hypothetical protein